MKGGSPAVDAGPLRVPGRHAFQRIFQAQPFAIRSNNALKHAAPSRTASNAARCDASSPHQLSSSCAALSFFFALVVDFAVVELVLSPYSPFVVISSDASVFDRSAAPALGCEHFRQQLAGHKRAKSIAQTAIVPSDSRAFAFVVCPNGSPSHRFLWEKEAHQRFSTTKQYSGPR